MALVLNGGDRGSRNSNLAISLSGNVDHVHMCARRCTTRTHATHTQTHLKVGEEKRNVLWNNALLLVFMLLFTSQEIMLVEDTVLTFVLQTVTHYI